jgi:hypothetical protein
MSENQLLQCECILNSCSNSLHRIGGLLSNAVRMQACVYIEAKSCVYLGDIFTDNNGNVDARKNFFMVNQF